MKVPANTAPALDPEEVAELLREGNVELIDVREPYERAAGYIPGSRHIPLAELAGALDSLQPNQTLIVACRLGARSGLAAEALRAAGFDARNLNGGLLAWARAGLALAPAGGRVADH
ncbi:MAG: hypothetical protein NVSMB25_13840 [Thermoleophilaceae bacterium]